MKEMNDFLRSMLKVGTPACGLLSGVCGFLFVLLLVFIGFWKTLLAAAVTALCVFLGGNANKGQAIKNLINKCFPPKE